MSFQCEHGAYCENDAQVDEFHGQSEVHLDILVSVGLRMFNSVLGDGWCLKAAMNNMGQPQVNARSFEVPIGGHGE